MEKQSNYRVIVSERAKQMLVSHAAFLAQGDMTLSDYQKIADYSFGDIIKAILFVNQEEDDDE